MTTTHPTITITETDQVVGVLADHLWVLYRDAMAPLDDLAAQRHLMYRGEFDQVIADQRITKHIAWDRGDPVGLATFTRDLQAVPLISPAYFARRWPDLYAQRKIWYVPFLAVKASAQGLGVFHSLAQHLLEQPAAQGGVVGLDVCAHNEQRRFPQLIGDTVRAAGADVDVYRADTQSCWCYEFPGPTAVRTS